MNDDDGLADLLIRHRYDLLWYVERHAGPLLRFETAEDLLQGIHLRAIERGQGFQYRGEEAFLGWLYRVARSCLADRKEHWTAIKRKPSRLLRLTEAGGEDDAAAPPSPATSPPSFAERKEQLALAIQALAVLLPRDRNLVRWTSEGLTTHEQAERLGISSIAAERARQRALERFKKAYRLLARSL